MKVKKLTLSISEAAVVLGVSVPVCRRMVKANQIPIIRCGGKVIIPIPALERYLLNPTGS